MVRIDEVGGDAGTRSSSSDHAWDLSAADRLGRLEIEDHYDDAHAHAGPAAAAATAASGAGRSGAGAGGGLCLDPREAERLVDGLETFGLEDVGSSRYVFGGTDFES